MKKTSQKKSKLNNKNSNSLKINKKSKLSNNNSNNFQSKINYVQNNVFLYKIMVVVAVLFVLGIVTFVSVENPIQQVDSSQSFEEPTKIKVNPLNKLNPSNLIGKGFDFQVSDTEEYTLFYDLKIGLNLISTPIAMDETSVKTIFPDALDTYIYDNELQSWTKTNVLKEGEVYFLIYPKNDNTRFIQGHPILSYKSNIKAGWNAISSFINLNQEETNFNHEFPLMKGSLLTFDTEKSIYYSTNLINPGKGYFVLSDQNSEIPVNINGLEDFPATSEELSNALEAFGSLPPSIN